LFAHIRIGGNSKLEVEVKGAAKIYGYQIDQDKGGQLYDNTKIHI